VLKDTFVSGLPGLLGPAVYPQWSVLFSYARVSVCSFGQCCVFSNFLSKVSSPSLLRFVFENSVSILCKPYCLNWCNHCLVFVAEWHVRMPVFCHRIKTLFIITSFILFTEVNSVSKTKHHLISVCKLAKNCFKT